MIKALCTFAIFAGALFGADVTGKWSGPMEMTRDGQTREDSAYLILKQEGATITGSVGPNADKQLRITTGTIDGGSISIEAEVPNNKGRLVLKLKIEGDQLKGELATEGSNSDAFTGKMTLSKVE